MAERRQRAYHSPLRAARAAATRQRILAAARALFARQGYAATTLEAVAAEAGVAVQTVYQVFGNKKRLLEAQLDAIDEVGRLDELQAVLKSPTATPHAMASALAAFVRRVMDGAGDVLEAAREAGRADPALQFVLEGGLARHNAGVARITALWSRRGSLRPGLGAREAAAIVASVSGPDVYHRLTRDWKWTPARYEAWLADAIVRLVLRD